MEENRVGGYSSFEDLQKLIMSNEKNAFDIKQEFVNDDGYRVVSYLRYSTSDLFHTTSDLFHTTTERTRVEGYKSFEDLQKLIMSNDKTASEFREEFVKDDGYRVVSYSRSWSFF